ncbi:MAG: SPFH domain-containing protein [Victivallales bacterium]|nr:SPFH domain-containing protein [Victivallales bacterium]MBR5079001.1 SPFH domain-containing protein [Victivallales bacterium]
MGIMNFIKNQLIDIVEWPEETPGVLVHRFERAGNEIKRGAKLVVRPGQSAVFVNEGQIADKFEPGTYSLETKNLPILTTILSLPYGFNSWHKAEVYFIKRTEQLDRKWGTSQPIVMRDADFGRIRIRAFGNYSYRVGMTDNMLQRFVGAKSEFKAEELEKQIQLKAISEFSDSLGELQIPALDLVAKYNEIGERVMQNLQPVMNNMGLELMTFTVGNISLPDEVNAAIDRAGAINSIGEVQDNQMRKYQQAQAADAMRDMAQNQGTGGTMMGMMMGGNLGAFAGQQFQQSQQPQYQQPQQQMAPPPPPPAAPMFYVAVNGQQQGPFTIQALQGMIASGGFGPNSLVWTAGMSGWQAANTVAALSGLFGAVPPPPPPIK